ncbi:TIR-only protein-like [Eucalyptus grandis]|uniref:TIR-only protein-like n=1 Tax=Eucalyptus grandis TaxID=71139 RepID=UPI00192F0145|nr:TIR-only protein-like [Eucalyptus grandis]
MSFQIAVYNYQVFLIFRGPDVRDSFLECFHDPLKGAGIVAFLDRKEIEYGERIDDKIVEAIKCSYICVLVFSKDFASSPTCLMEVALMVEFDKTILPIFYDVEPFIVSLPGDK